MQQTKAKQYPIPSSPKRIPGDYIEDLQVYNAEVVIDGIQYKIGEPKQAAGWVFHLSATRSQIKELFEAVFPFLQHEKIPFRIYRNEILNAQMLNGDLGYVEIGKVVTIFPVEGNELATAFRLIELTKGIKGPAVPTDRHLGNAVYTRFSAIKPIVMLDETGNLKNFYANALGQLVADEVTVPYQAAKFVLWPFKSITEQAIKKQPKFFKRKYVVTYWIKKDAKGYVGKGINLINLLKQDWCIIKEGKAHMAHDDNGRDIQDRLTWQWDLQVALYKKVNIPKPVDFFVSNGNTYFVMEFIEGKSFEEIIAFGVGNNAWFSIPSSIRLQLLTHYLHILDQVAILHDNGYIHRDLTPGNFVITKNGKEYLIDLEMAYSEQMKRPFPPFRFGTWGFMSPEQRETAVPTVKEDIYGLGAMLINILTDCIPLKFEGPALEKVIDNLSFFSGDKGISSMAAAAICASPDERPTLADLREETKAYMIRIKENEVMMGAGRENNIDKIQLKTIIQKGINGLGDSDYIGNLGIWTSQLEQEDNTVGNLRLDRQELPGLKSGVAGIIYSLGVAVKAGFTTRFITPTLNKGMQLLQRNIEQYNGLPPGLFGGCAGMAIALNKAIQSKLLSRKTAFQDTIAGSIHLSVAEPSLSMGKSGQGMAALSCMDLINLKAERRVKVIVNEICSMQQKDGSWLTPVLPYKELHKLKIWSDGTAGIAFFLGCYLEAYDDPKALVCLEKALSWIGDRIEPPQKRIRIISKDSLPPKYSLRSGRAGLALTYVQAYKATKKENYKQTAEKIMEEIPANFNKGDVTLLTGISGMGSLYLEAALTFNNPKWQQRADWITQAILHQYVETNQDAIVWNTSNKIVNTADFMTGQAGVIYYLIKYLYPDLTEPIFF